LFGGSAIYCSGGKIPWGPLKAMEKGEK